MASTTRTKKDGVSLAKGPVAILGAVMLAYGIIAFLLGGNGFSASPPSGDVNGDTFLRLEGNGWTNLLWAASGALLLFGSPFHWGAKSTAMIVGLVLGAASVIAMFDGFETGDVLGIFASNGWTILALGAASALLLLSSFLPKVGKKRHVEHDHHAERVEPVRETRTTEREVVAPADGTGVRHTEREPLHGETAETRLVRAEREPTTAREDEGRFERSRDRIEDPQVRAARDAEQRH